ncbi:hypothetical protein BDV26DRAFT_289981 [Aspergillus bertholletiae]|uniref:Transcription factor domain-containing protein n=1 Tax=Aspergillus bertholletiae TaxID=1226010 RepID=A0A5N7BGJ0_9EURO|nr:hypothetical protein BDV26DRAFT_289981 [Aspergillus bertholletiae]
MTRPDSLQHPRYPGPQRQSRPIPSPAVALNDRDSIVEDVQVDQEVSVTQPSDMYGANSPPPSPAIHDICTTDIQQGSTLLKRLNQISTLAKLAEQYIRLQGHMIPIPAFLAKKAIASLEEDPSIEKMSTRDQLATSIIITGNTCRELELEACTSPNDVCKAFTGPALRWEALGLLFTWAALALLHSHVDDSLAANLCISLCKEYAPANEVLLWLLHECLILSAQFYGDCSHQTWQRLGDLATEALDPTIAKLDAGNMAVPFLLTQSRRKILASAYWMDKSLASVYGQVPRISCLPQDFEIPLDIDDDEPFVKGFPRSELLNLHSTEWNYSGYTCPATYIRARYILSSFRDKLLHLSFTASTVNRLPELKHLYQRYRTAWLEMPKRLHYRDNDQVQAIPYMTSFPQLLIFLDYLQGEYLIYKEFSGIIESMRPQILWQCKRILSIVIGLFVSPKMRTETSPLERIRAAMLYGVPCAEYLIFALKEYNGYSKGYDHSPPPLELIRNISDLTSSLEQEFRVDDQLNVSYIHIFWNLECALNDLLDLKQICALGYDLDTSSLSISPGSDIVGNSNTIGSELISWTDGLPWVEQCNVEV